MSTTVPKEALRTLFATLSGLPSARVIWAGEPLPFVGPTDAGVSGLLILQIIARRRVGVDDERKTYNHDGTTTITRSGDRVLTLQARAEKYATSDDGIELLEVVRLGIDASPARASLVTAGLSLATVDDVRNLGGTADNRATFFASLDLTLNQQVSTSTTVAPEVDTYIAEVEATGEDDLAPAGVLDVGPVPAP